MSKEKVLLNLSLEDFKEFETKRALTGMDKQHLVRVLLDGLQPFYKIEEEDNIREFKNEDKKINRLFITLSSLIFGTFLLSID